jgi:hypothetical protein
MLSYVCCLKKFGLVYGSVEAGAALKFFLGAEVVSKWCGTAKLSATVHRTFISFIINENNQMKNVYKWLVWIEVISYQIGFLFESSTVLIIVRRYSIV